MINSSEYSSQHLKTKVLRSSVTLNNDYFSRGSQQQFNLYKLTREITTQIINTIAEAGIAPSGELEALIAAAGIDVTSFEQSSYRQIKSVCPHCGQ